LDLDRVYAIVQSHRFTKILEAAFDARRERTPARLMDCRIARQSKAGRRARVITARLDGRFGKSAAGNSSSSHVRHPICIIDEILPHESYTIHPPKSGPAAPCRS